MTHEALRKLLITLTTTTFLSIGWPGSILADSDRIEALEARIAELEALVYTLLQQQEADSEEMETLTVESVAADAAEAKVLSMMEGRRLAEVSESNGTTYKFGGYIKTDVLYSDYSSGPVPASSPGRDFYIPATVPTGPPGAAGQSYLDFQAKESRLNFRVDHTTDNGARMAALIEVDFLMSGHGDERVSNSYNPRLRQAFLTYNRWLFGQAWTTFFNVSALPDNLDFIGPSESTIFGRQAMIRYNRGPWQLALENPETTVTPYGGGDRIVADSSHVPDAVVRYNYSGEWATFTAAGILRQLAIRDNAAGIDDTTTGYGISLSGKFRVGARDDFRWMASIGKGLGRYIGLNTSNGAVLDEFGYLHAIGLAGLFGSYRHCWNEKWHSNLTLGYLAVDNPIEYTGTGVTRNASSGHINLIYSPWPILDFGIEFIYADRELESGDDGDLKRLQFSARYAF